MLLDGVKPLSEERHPFFGPNEDDWNLDLDIDDDDYGKPGVGVMAGAISTWSARNGSLTIGDAAKAFNMPPEAVAQCIEFRPWMYFVGDEATPLEDMRIEHEGE